MPKSDRRERFEHHPCEGSRLTPDRELQDHLASGSDSRSDPTLLPQSATSPDTQVLALRLMPVDRFAGAIQLLDRARIPAGLVEEQPVRSFAVRREARNDQ